MKRIFLYLATNVAVMILITAVFQLFGLQGILAENGIDLNLQAVMIMSLVVGFAGSLISLAMSKSMARRAMGVHVIDHPTNNTEMWLVDTISRQAQLAGIGMPEVGVFDSPQPNAFATGANRNNALVAVSTGLLEAMNRDEVEAVLGHEISHVANGDMVTMALMQGVINALVMFLAIVVGHVVDRVVFKTERGNGPAYYFFSMLSQVLFSVLASIIVMWFSRQREYRADKGGAELAGRDKMIASLRKLQQAHDPQDLPDQFAAFGISGGLGSGLKGLFLSHPPLEQRIEALQQMSLSR